MQVLSILNISYVILQINLVTFITILLKMFYNYKIFKTINICITLYGFYKNFYYLQLFFVTFFVELIIFLLNLVVFQSILIDFMIDFLLYIFIFLFIPELQIFSRIEKALFVMSITFYIVILNSIILQHFSLFEVILLIITLLFIIYFTRTKIAYVDKITAKINKILSIFLIYTIILMSVTYYIINYNSINSSINKLITQLFFFFKIFILYRLFINITFIFQELLVEDFHKQLKH